MGLFDLFKKKETKETLKSEIPKTELFSFISIYNEYIVRFIEMQQQGNFAPISAYQNANAEIIGFLYFYSGDDDSYSLSAQEVIHKMESNFEQKIANNEINSYTIFYHSQFAYDDNHKLATSEDELKAISISYHFKNGKKGTIGLPYSYENDEITYKGFKDFSKEENDLIFRKALNDNKNYFQHREEVKSPVVENEIGLKIKKSNSTDLNNTWAGIFGFDSYEKPGGDEVLKEHFALAIKKGVVIAKDNVSISQLEYEDVILKGITLEGKPIAILPVIKTENAVDVMNKQITEWENVDNLEAIIMGSARGNFGVIYLATDYAENKEVYLSKEELNVKISGIAFVLDMSILDKSEGAVKFSDDFTIYMPSKDLPNYACFDFIGLLVDYKETNLLEDGGLKGYIMKVQLAANPDIKDSFTIDIFVSEANMRFKEFTKGMKLAGMFQMQGHLVE
ncbi:hypothetical protein [Pedobacter polysacchareus]|uniref:hypothetical protein n=1 Tax=Pedobacter polysacchareus TaxID=2861973 RepID=UPI001C9A1746|nr:hypothetical protein [Pedobacter polysacchareus]